jgi:hypothetical protein
MKQPAPLGRPTKQSRTSANDEIMRAFVRLRHLLATNADLSRRVDALEAKYDKHFRVVFDAIRQLMVEPEPPGTQRIGFKTT